MADFIDDYLSSGINPIGISYTDGTTILDSNEPNAKIKKSVSNTIDTFGYRDEAIGWELNNLNPDVLSNVGLTRNRRTLEAANNGTLDKQLAELQSAREKAWNSVKQAVVSETVLGTIGSFGTLFDIVTGQVFKEDNDYNNPWSEYFNNLQEQYKKNNPIYVDPTKAHSPATMGWWASNFPSILSSLTLLIPSTGITKGLGAITKATKLDKLARTTTKALTGARKAKTAEEVAALNPVTRALNSASTIEGTNRFLEVGTNAIISRSLENWQEARQVWNDQYNQASESFNAMSDEEWADYLNRHSYIREELGENPTKDETAKFIAKKSADETFVDDYANTIFDVAQLYALKNPLKLAQNMRTTTAVRRADRLSKRYAGRMAQAESLEAKRTLKQKTKDYLSDRLGNTQILAAELSEGVEEAINYVAQQEGMHLGNVLLDKEDYSTFNDRFWSSYYNSPELYESAFWGWLGGIVFQVGGSGIQRASNVISSKFKSSNKEDDKTKEKTNKALWQDEYETAETKKRVESISKRDNDLTTYAERMKLITAEDAKNPFDNNAPFTSDIEKLAAAERAKQEFITSMTLREMDSGNLGLLKDYLRDTNVRQALIDAGVTDAENVDEFVTDAITKIENVEQKYNDNLLALDNISSGLDSTIPIEYLQIIARDNVAAQMSVDDLTRRIDGYNVSARTNERRYKVDESDAMDFKTAASMVVAARRLAMLRAQKRELESDEKVRNTIEGRINIDDIDKQIEQVNDYLLGQSEDFTTNLPRLLWANAMSYKGVLDDTSNLSLENTDEYLDFLNKIARKDKFYSLDAKHKFELTDEQILSLFGENGTDGSYATLGEKIDYAFDRTEGADRLAPVLNDDYQTIANLEINRYIRQNEVATTLPDVQKKVNELHNFLNMARREAINKANDIIFEAGKKYGYSAINNMIFGDEEVEGMSEKDKQNIKSALDVLNLTSASNAQLAEDLHNSLMLAYIESLQTNNGEENSTISENPSESSEISEVGESSPQAAERSSEPANEEIRPSESENPIKAKQLSLDLDSGISVKEVDNTGADDEFLFTEDGDGNVTLLAQNKESIAPKLLGSELFEGYDENNTQPYTIVSNPVVKQEDGIYKIVSKGVINYGVEEAVAASPMPISSTGGVEEQTAIGLESEEQPTNADEQAQATQPGEEELDDIDVQEQIIAQTHAAIKARKNASPDGKLTNEDFAAVAQELKEGKNEQEASYVDRAINIIRKVAERQGLIKDIGDVIERSSSIVEMRNRINFTEDAEDYKKALAQYNSAITKLLKDYCTKCKIEEVDGKTAINLEDLLRFVNDTFEDKGLGNIIYQGLYDYLTKAENKEKYTATDRNVDDKRTIVNNARKTREERIKEIVGSTFEKNRVDINALFNNLASMTEEEQDSFRKAFQSIRKGDVLAFDISEHKNGTDILLKKNGVTIGRLPAPNRVETGSYAGCLYMRTMGWKAIVDKNGNSPLKDFFNALVDDEKINDLLINYAKYKDTLSKKDKEKAVNTIYKAVSEKLNDNEILNPKESKQNAVDYLALLWGYTNVAFNDTENRNDYIRTTLDMWFEKLANSYYTLDSIQENLNTDKDSVKITVANINSGKLNRVVQNSKENKTQEYISFNYASKAIADKNNTEIGVVNKDGHSNFCINTTNGSTITDHSDIGNTGTLYAIIQNQSGKTDIAIGTATRLGDTSTKIGKTGRELLNAVNKEITRLFAAHDKAPSEETFNNLATFLRFCFGTNNGTPLFYGTGVTVRPDKITLSLGKQRRIVIHKGNNKITQYAEDDKTPISETEIKDSKDIIKDYTKNAKFNMPFLAFGPPTNVKLSAYHRENNETDALFIIDEGGVYIKIGENTWNFDTFKDYVFATDAIKFNVAVDEETGTNYKRLDDIGGGGNMILEVNIETTSSRPVEDITPETSTSPAITILNDSSIEHKGNALAKLIINPEEASTEEEKTKRENVLNSLDKLHLLPKDVIFDENLNVEKNKAGEWLGDNARTKLSTRKVTVGNKWLDMLNETGEFAAYPKGEAKMQALRKLIHEQLHIKLNGKNKAAYLKRIEGIYNEFKEYLDKNKVAEDDHIRSYLFANESEEVALEEFLVESLTSAELATYLNSIESEVEDKKLANNLWQKIMKLLSDIFEWGITEGSLYEKELHSLQDVIKSIEPTVKETRVETAPTETSNVEQEVEEQQEVTFNLDDLDEDTANNDEMRSSIVEINKHPSLDEFISTLPIEQQVIIAPMFERGDVSIICSR